MNEHIARQAREMLAAAAKTEVPPEMRALAQETVAKAREAVGKWTSGARQGAHALEEVALTAQTGLRTISEKAFDNALANTETAFEAAEKLARASTLTEAAQLQARFLQDQLAVVSRQGRELVELSVKAAQETKDALTLIATKFADDLKVA